MQLWVCWACCVAGLAQTERSMNPRLSPNPKPQTRAPGGSNLFRSTDLISSSVINCTSPTCDLKQQLAFLMALPRTTYLRVDNN